jgi:uncharacterized protein YcaQ
MSSPATSISADHARRFLASRHLLAPSRSLPAQPASVMTVVERLGLLQFDPLEVPGARNHDLVLHARIAGYRREWCDALLYGPDRQLIELYNKSLNILPIDQLPHYRVTWDRNAPQLDGGILKEQADVATAILAKLKADGPLSTAAFAEHGHAVDWWWAPTRASRAVMEALFVAGRIGIARRDGNRRYYDLIERLVPAGLLSRRESEEDGRRHRLLSRYRATGMTTPVGTQAEVMYSVGSQTERVQWTERLVADGELLPIHVEGLKRPQYIIADEEPLLDATADPASMLPRTVGFLAALDPLVWDRRLLRELWGFDYLWEVYVPEAKRKWGYYVLPLLFGDRFVGRIEPRIERRTSTLRILGIWFEAGFAPMDAPGFIGALRDAIAAYRCFVGATTVEWPRTRIGREIGRAIREAA